MLIKLLALAVLALVIWRLIEVGKRIRRKLR